MSMEELRHKSPQLDPEALFLGTSSVGSFSLSPDGEVIAFSWKRGGHEQVYISSLERFSPSRLTSGEEACVSPTWSPDGSRVAFVRHGERSSIMAIDLTTRDVTILVDLERGPLDDLSWSPDGSSLAFSHDGGEGRNIFSIQSDGSSFKRLTSGPGQDWSPLWSPDGGRLLYLSDLPGAERDREARIIYFNGSGIQSIGFFRSATWSPCGRKLFVTSGEHFHTKVGSVDLASRSTDWLSGDDLWMSDPVCSLDGSKLACVCSGRGNSRIAIIDIEARESVFLGPMNGLCGPPVFSPDGLTVICSHRGPKEPDGLWSLDLSRSNAHQLLDCLPDSIDQRLLSDPEETHYTSFDGQEIPAFLYRPSRLDRGSPPPAIVWLHGGPNFQFFNMWHPMIQMLQSSGYLILAPNFRGSIGYGRDYCDLKKGDWAGGDLLDVVAAADWLDLRGFADGSRIALLGGSYGGYLALMTLAKAPGRWAAGVDLFGFVNLETFYRNTPDYVQLMIRSQIGTPEENAAFYHERSPINVCDSIMTPLLILHGSEDKVVPPSESGQIADRMHSLGRRCELKIFDGRDHRFQGTAGQIECIKAVQDFLDRYLIRAEQA